MVTGYCRRAPERDSEMMARLENDADAAQVRLVNSEYFRKEVRDSISKLLQMNQEVVSAGTIKWNDEELVRGADCEEITDAIDSLRDLLPAEEPKTALGTFATTRAVPAAKNGSDYAAVGGA